LCLCPDTYAGVLFWWWRQQDLWIFGKLVPHHTVLHSTRREATHRRVRRFETLRIKKAKRLCPLTSVLRCRDQGTVPRFRQFYHNIHFEAAKRTYRSPTFCTIRERIHHTAQPGWHLACLAGSAPTVDWGIVDRWLDHSRPHHIQEGIARCARRQRQNV
jgi:hypothetical protein